MPDAEEFARQDGISLALHRLVARSPVALPPPYALVRERGMRRRGRRRAVVAASVAVCAVAVLGSIGALSQGRAGEGGPAAGALPAAGAPVVNSTAGAPAGALAPTTTIDLAAHRLTVDDGAGRIRSLPVTAGRPGYATRPGRMRVAEKQATTRMSAGTAGLGPQYDLDVHWCVRLVAEDGYTTSVCALDWQSADVIGKENVTSGLVGLSPEDARWYFGEVAVGEVVELVDPEPDAAAGTPSAP